MEHYVQDTQEHDAVKLHNEPIIRRLGELAHEEYEAARARRRMGIIDTFPQPLSQEYRNLHAQLKYGACSFPSDEYTDGK